MSIPNKEKLFLLLTKEVLPYIKEKSEKVINAFLNDIFSSNYTSITQPYVGAVLITFINGHKFLKDGVVICLYYHCTKNHTAITHGSLGRKASVAPPKEWAISIQTKSMYGNKANYQTEGC